MLSALRREVAAAIDQAQRLGRQRQAVSLAPRLEGRHGLAAMPEDLAGSILEVAVGAILHPNQPRRQYRKTGFAGHNNRRRVSHGIKRDTGIGRPGDYILFHGHDDDYSGVGLLHPTPL
jgi:hypothetical protein